MKPLSKTARIFRLRAAAFARMEVAEDLLWRRHMILREAEAREARCRVLRMEVKESGLKPAAIASAAGIQKPNFHSMLTGMRPVTAARLDAVRAAIAKLTAQ